MSWNCQYVINKLHHLFIRKLNSTNYGELQKNSGSVTSGFFINFYPADKKNTDNSKVKMLTADGKLVEVR